MLLKPGDPMDEKTTHGPLSTESALVQLLKQIDVAVSKGAKVALGGKRIDQPGSFMQTTILTDVKPDNPAFRDEFFGPVAMFFRVKDEAAAIELCQFTMIAGREERKGVEIVRLCFFEPAKRAISQSCLGTVSIPTNPGRRERDRQYWQ